MTYRPRYRKMNEHLAQQITKQEERIKSAWRWAILLPIGSTSEDFKLTGTFYSNRFKK